MPGKTQKIFGFTAENRVDFVVRVVAKGDKYGLDNCLTHDKDEPLVEFYDARFSHCEYGQFVARYHLTTIENSWYGLCLDGGVASWNIDHNSMNKVRDFLKRWGHASC